MRPFIKDLLLSLIESYEIVLLSDLGEKANHYLVKHIEEKIGKKIFSFILSKDHHVQNNKNGRIAVDLNILQG